MKKTLPKIFIKISKTCIGGTKGELFWDVLKRLQNNNFEKKNLNETLPSAQSAMNHYKDIIRRSLTRDINGVGKEIDSSVFEKLSTTITLDQIKKAIQSLKSKKAPGINGITNEIIKHSGKLLMKNIQELFNQTFNSGYLIQRLRIKIWFFQYIKQAKKIISIIIGVTNFNQL